MRLSRKRAGWLAAALLGAVAALPVADALAPPDLSRLARGSTVVTDREGRILRAFLGADGTWRFAAKIEDVSPLYLAMLVAYEDRRFAEHRGVDGLAALRAAAQAAWYGRAVSGASTLTMQAARLLEPRPRRTLLAKFAETARALQLESRHSKAEILSIYLTLAPFGGNIEGVRAASLAWFGKEPRHLTAGEAALLVAIPQSPAARRPDRRPEAARKARNRVIDRMEEAGVLSPAQAQEARAEKMPGRRFDLPFLAPHLAAELHRREPAQRRFVTTLDGKLQAAVEGVLRGELGGQAAEASIAALIVDHRSGEVRAYAGSAAFFDALRQGQVDMVRAIRSPGSTLKPFVYGMGFDQGIVHPETILRDAPTRFGDYQPENFLRGYHGEVSVKAALQHSLNIPAVAVMEGVGPERFVARLAAAGVTLRFDRPGEKPGLPVALGGVGMSLYDLVTLYAGLAQSGSVRPLRTLADEPAAPPGQLVSPAAAWYLARILEAAPPPVDAAPIQRTNRALKIAYKTGTSYGFRDAWAVGYDGAHTIGVWVGRADGTPLPDRYGRGVAAPILFKLFDLLPESKSGAAGPAVPAKPADALDVPHGKLPLPLRRYAPKSAPTAGRGADGTLAAAVPVQISFPPAGATVELEPRGDGQRYLPLSAEGGRVPLRWIVNGAPLDGQGGRRQAYWRPDSPGFVQVTVIDADGRSASVEARVK